MARKTLNRKELRENFDSAERAEGEETEKGASQAKKSREGGQGSPSQGILGCL